MEVCNQPAIRYINVTHHQLRETCSLAVPDSFDEVGLTGSFILGQLNSVLQRMFEYKLVARWYAVARRAQLSPTMRKRKERV